MSTIGDALLDTGNGAGGPKIEALVVYNSNPVAVAPESAKVAAGFAREDLFTVVLEHFRTDTADYADVLLPATTQLEHVDVHKAYGHTYFLANNAAVAPLGEALPNTEIFRRLAQRMGFADACFTDSDEDIAAQAILRDDPRAQGISWETLKARGWQKLNLPAAPFADGGFPTASGKCEFYSEAMRRDGIDPLPAYVPPYEAPATAPELASRYPLAMISPPARNFLNSTFVNVDSLRATEGEPHRTSTRKTRRRAASRPARWCAPSTIAAACWRAPASPIARAGARWWACRSGGRSWPRTARTPTS